MLYVFHVDVGRMMNFDMNVAMSSVENLKDTIERLHNIPAANIVLLVSGGEMLTMSTQVSYYSAGTDTNPIYMFLTGDTRLQQPAITAAAHMELDLDLREQVERCLELPAVYETVVTRSLLAMRMHDMARDEERLCERLVHEQHLQQQGWSAVVANMEDLTDEFRHRFQNFCHAFDQHLSKRNRYLNLLRHFGDDLTNLAQIPILPGLMGLAEQDFHGFDEYLDQDEVFSRSHTQQSSVLAVGGDNVLAANITTNEPENSSSSTSPNKKAKMGNYAIDTTTTTTAVNTTTTTNTNVTTTVATSSQTTNTTNSSTSSATRRRHLNLLQWITSKENHNTLKLMSDECIQALGTFNNDVYEQLKYEVQNIIRLADQTDIKEIKGLGERLCKLDEFKYKIKNMVNDQKELSTAFQHNQHRANKLRDPTILPDLCASHQSQMQVMLQNHQKIRDHRKLIARAKDELGSNLATRLKRIVCIENAMSDFDNRLLFYLRCLRRAERHIHIIEQIHQAPGIYVAAVTEVVRRKIFSGEFRLWATKLAEDFDKIHSEEVKRRELFNASFEGHFLNILFPGMKDMPPAFANETPLVFDARLPNLTRSDIDVLSVKLPELAPQIVLPDMGPVINFFVSRSGEHQQKRLEQLLKQQMTTTGNAGTDVKKSGCDESTATDADENEFEKVVTDALLSSDTHNIPAIATIARSTTTEPLPLMQSAGTLTDVPTTEISARAEVERLRSVLSEMSKLALRCICEAREHMATLRADTTNLSEGANGELQLLRDKCQLMCLHTTERERDIDLMREQLQQNESTHIEELNKLRENCAILEEQIAELRAQLDSAETIRNEAVATEREQLIHEHKKELEALRCRFKLMTSMESMPSPVESGSSVGTDTLSLEEHQAILTQLRSELEHDKENAIAAAVEAERAMWQVKMFSLNPDSVMANVNVLREMLEEKERQLEQLRERDLMQTKENYQLKTRLHALTNEDGNSWMKEKIEFLNRDKCRLEEELNMERSRRVEMETSVAAIRSSTTVSSGSGAKTCASSHSRCISLESCSKGDIVFVVWSMRHGQYVVVQDSSSLYFVHGDSLLGLNLRLPPTPNLQIEGSGPTGTVEAIPTIPLPFYGIGRVVDKEYCAARKDENRYRVSKGSRFYRIKLAPLATKQSSSRRDRMELSSVSRSITHCEAASHESFYAGGAVVAAAIRPSRSMSSTAVAAGQQNTLNATLNSTVATTVSTATTTSVIAKDVVDHMGNLSPTASTTTLTASSGSGALIYGRFKERTISVTSVTLDDSDEPLSLLSDGGGSSGGGATVSCRYLSVSEEDEVEASSINLQQQQQQQPSVITEQPTSTTSRCQLNTYLTLANSAVLPENINTNIQQQQEQQHDQHEQDVQGSMSAATEIITSSIEQQQANVQQSNEYIENAKQIVDENPKQEDEETQVLQEDQQQEIDKSKTNDNAAVQQRLSLDAALTLSPTHQPSGGTISTATTSEDSDEYRSLDPKDEEDTEFAAYAEQ